MCVQMCLCLCKQTCVQCTDVSVSVYTYVCTDVSVYTDVCAASEQVCAIHLKCGVGHCYASMPLFPFALLFLSWACLF